MNGKLASLIADRHTASLDDRLTADYRFLVRNVFPLISSAAHKGLKQACVPGLVNDNQFKMIRDMGYVVRHERMNMMTSIEWCDQAAAGPAGGLDYISPVEFNRRADEYQRKLKGE